MTYEDDILRGSHLGTDPDHAAILTDRINALTVCPDRGLMLAMLGLGGDS